jgi:hypothetical protein
MPDSSPYTVPEELVLPWQAACMSYNTSLGCTAVRAMLAHRDRAIS